MFQLQIVSKQENKTLAGKSVLVTRSEKQITTFSQRLQELGAFVIEFPVISIRAPESLVELDLAITQIETYDWIVFASANAAEFFLARLQASNPDKKRLKAQNLAVIGPATALALERHGLFSSFTPTSFIADRFVQEFVNAYNLTGKRILWPRATVGRQVIKDRLSEIGALVDAVPVYEAILPSDSVSRCSSLLELFRNRKIDFVTLTSSQSARNFAQLLRTAIQKEARASEACASPLLGNSPEIQHLLKSTRLVSIGPETSKAIRETIGCPCIQAGQFTIPGMIEKLVELAAGSNNPPSGGSNGQARA